MTTRRNWIKKRKKWRKYGRIKGSRKSMGSRKRRKMIKWRKTIRQKWK